MDKQTAPQRELFRLPFFSQCMITIDLVYWTYHTYISYFTPWLTARIMGTFSVVIKRQGSHLNWWINNTLQDLKTLQCTKIMKIENLRVRLYNKIAHAHRHVTCQAGCFLQFHHPYNDMVSGKFQHLSYISQKKELSSTKHGQNLPKMTKIQFVPH